MIRIRRYGIAFGRTLWLQTRVPTRVWRFLWFWFIREARPDDVDTKQQFPLGTPMKFEGRRFRYWKADRDVKKGEVVMERSGDASH